MLVYSIQVYSKLYTLQQIVVTSHKFTLGQYSLQQIVVTYKLQVYIIFNIVYSKLLLTNQCMSYYTLHSFVAFVFFVQSEPFPPVQLEKQLHSFLWE